MPLWLLSMARTGPVPTTVLSSSLRTVGSPPPVAVAVFTSGLAAFAATATVRVIGLPALVAAIAVLLVQVTSGATAPQTQPVPVAET